MAQAQKYHEQLEKERELINKGNPFSKPVKKKGKQKARSTPHVSKKEKDSNYFNLILTSDFEDLEMDIRGLREYRDVGEDGKERIIFKRRPNHFLSEDGAEDLLLELRTHLNSDIKLAIFTRDEFLQAQDAIRKHFLSYISNNLYSLGMDTEQKQRNAPLLANRILLRIRAVYSRNVAGIENERSHGDIKLTGEIDHKKEDRYKIEDLRN